MLLNYLTLFIALSISGVAIYYSVAGLAAIFAASVIPIIIMGSVLEIGKLATAVWLHRNWKHAVWWLKTYLSIAVIVLMFITSLGIFGFLSKSHIEQSAASDEQIAKIDLINEKLNRSNAQMSRWQAEILRISSGSTSNIRVDNLIDRENKALDKIKQQINSEREQIGYDIDSANKSLTKMQKAIGKDKDRLQRQIQTEIDLLEQRFLDVRTMHNETMQILNKQASNCFSCSDEELAIKTEKDKFITKEQANVTAITQKQQRLQTQTITITQNYDAQKTKTNARLDQLQDQYDTVGDRHQVEIDAINIRIAKLKDQSNNKTDSIEDRIVSLENNIAAEQEDISQYRVDKSVLESQFRKLEAEVGPIKYVAEAMYEGDADRNMLEDAVRFLIIVIIFVFDPLAVLLLIASQYSFDRNREIISTKNEDNNEKASNDPTRIADETPNNDTDASGKSNTVATKTKAVGTTRKKDSPKLKAAKKKLKDKLHIISDGIRFKYDSPGYMTAGDNKVHNIKAFTDLHPEMHLDFESEVIFGKEFPSDAQDGIMFMCTDTLPTKLYRFNGTLWDEVDKKLLHNTAYSGEYVVELMNTITDHEYDPILLNALLQEGTDDNQVIVLNNIELQLINGYNGDK